MRHPLIACLLLAGLLGCAKDSTPADPVPATTGAAASTAADSSGPAAPTSEPYPLSTCPVSGEELGSMGEAIVLHQPGREVQLCCKGCVESYEADPASFNATIDEQIIAAQKPTYPIETCLISGEVIGASDTMVPYDHVVGNRLYRLCCAACTKSLEKDLPKYRAELIAASSK